MSRYEVRSRRSGLLRRKRWLIWDTKLNVSVSIGGSRNRALVEAHCAISNERA